MTILQSIFLGLLQGVAEFLPISSSGHLAVAQHLFGLNDLPLIFDVMLHLATLLAVIIYYRKKLFKLICVFFCVITRRSSSIPENVEDGLCGTQELSQKTIGAVIVATLITGVIGVFTSKYIPDLPVKFVCTGFIVTGLMLLLTKILARGTAKSVNSDCSSDDAAITSGQAGISVKQSIIIGLMQGMGTLPGISRSGSTITGALACGVNKRDAGDFSFIVSIPAIFGAFLLEAKDLGEVASSIGFVPLAAGCITAFIAGYASLVALIKLIKKGKLFYFSIYLIPAGILGFLLF